ncbi:RING-H2 finger protein ATL40-like [Elaeis guineensis]|uniref:RING-type E3 ubiquitin transferase n=1 Tax=Elaeis guineensis var. tenera TaxID=51953 RepID=A0A6I9QWK9_ELAGV|nr:RING-H2 finger protein ATL40-like [Elaeis guineensis]
MATTGVTAMTTDSESSPAQHANLGIVAAEIAIFTIATYAASTIVIIICVYIWDRLWGRRRVLVAPPASRSTEAPGTALSPSAIAALPSFAYRRVMDGSGNENIGTSAQQTVCKSLVEEGEMVRLLPNCRHVFHVDCVDVWFRSHSTCPQCHSSVEVEEVVMKVEFGEGAAPLPPPV